MAFEFSDITDAVTSDEFFLIVGTIGTFGTYGAISGILNVTGLEKIALEEAMKGAAGMAGTALSGGKVELSPKGWLEGWKGQTVYRAKEVYKRLGSEGEKEARAQFDKYGSPEWQDKAKQLWEAKKKTEAFVRDAEKISREYLDELEKQCRTLIAGPIAPDKARTICRRDYVAMAANLANGETIFDVTDWDPLTGDPPDLTIDITRALALERYYEAVRRAGGADNDPGVARALAVYNAIKHGLTSTQAREQYYEAVKLAGGADTPEAARALELLNAVKRSEQGRAERKQAAADIQAGLRARCIAGDQEACALLPKVAETLATAPQGDAAAPSFTDRAVDAAKDIGTFALLTAPLWGTVLYMFTRGSRRRGRKSKGR